MKVEDFFIQYLYHISKDKKSKNFYLEGGASLSLIFGITRNFSNDLDFTINNVDNSKYFFELTSEIIASLFPGSKVTTNLKNSRISIKKGKKNLFHIDYFILNNRLFESEYASLKYGKQQFKIKTHSLSDILAEKICNVYEESRTECKDIDDIVTILKRYKFSNLKIRCLLLQKIKIKKIIYGSKDKFIARVISQKSNYIMKTVEKNFEKNFDSLIDFLRIIL